MFVRDSYKRCVCDHYDGKKDNFGKGEKHCPQDTNDDPTPKPDINKDKHTDKDKHTGIKKDGLWTKNDWYNE